jgi:hypothetical protein
MRQCSICKEFKIEREFNKDRTTPSGYDYRCKSCNSKRTKAMWASSEGKKKMQNRSRKYELRRLYGLTVEEYQTILEKQNYSCAACNVSQKLLSRQLDVDHCHITGKIRGLLCVSCNTALGLLKEDKERAKKLFQYLENNSPKNTQQEVTKLLEDVLRTTE